VPQDLLHLIQGPPAVNEQGYILVPQIMQTQLWQVSFYLVRKKSALTKCFCIIDG